MQYVKFTEHNEWEGETWHFWIPLQGNTDELKRLDQIIARNPEMNEFYELDLTPVSEAEVGACVAQSSNTDYLPEHNKLTGTLRLPADDAITDNKSDLLYKGGIRDYMQTT